MRCQTCADTAHPGFVSWREVEIREGLFRRVPCPDCCGSGFSSFCDGAIGAGNGVVNLGERNDMAASMLAQDIARGLERTGRGERPSPSNKHPTGPRANVAPCRPHRAMVTPAVEPLDGPEGGGPSRHREAR
jgi:hypothetical protein